MQSGACFVQVCWFVFLSSTGPPSLGAEAHLASWACWPWYQRLANSSPHSCFADVDREGQDWALLISKWASNKSYGSCSLGLTTPLLEGPAGAVPLACLLISTIRTTSELHQNYRNQTNLESFRLLCTYVADKVKGLEREYRRGADSVSRTWHTLALLNPNLSYLGFRPFPTVSEVLPTNGHHCNSQCETWCLGLSPSMSQVKISAMMQVESAEECSRHIQRP